MFYYSIFWELIHSKIMEISTIGIAEYAKLNATWLTLTETEFQCKAIEESYRGRTDADRVINYRRIEKGCGVISDTPKVEIDGIEFYSCLCHESYQDYGIQNSMWLFEQYKLGHLAYPGSLLEQPAKYIELMSLFSRLHTELETKMRNQNEESK